MRDEAQLKDYLNLKGADYIVAFPDWYPDLLNQAELVYETNGKFAPRLGYENMAVYRWSANE